MVGARAQIDRALEGDAEEDDPRPRIGLTAGDESGLGELHDARSPRTAGRAPRHVRRPKLDDVVVGEEGYRRQGAARALHPVLDGADLPVADLPATDFEGLAEHLDDGPLGLLPSCLVVELHDDAVLRSVLGARPADG